MSSKGAKRSRRVSGEALEAPAAGGPGGAGGGGPASAASSAAPASSTALVRSRRRSATAADNEGGAGGALVVGITAAEMSRFVEEQLRGVQSDHARELAAVNRELTAVRNEHAREHVAMRRDYERELAVVRRELASMRRDHASELADARYETSRRFVLLDSRGATSEIGLVCRRGITGLDEYNEYRSVLSVLFGFQEFSDLADGLMRFFTTKEARELRLVHSEFLDAINATPWHDMDTKVNSPVAAWRACFPNAKAAKLGKKVVDSDFVHLRGLRSLDMSYCTSVSDAAFVNLRGLDSLQMWHCSQPSITSSAFTSLKGLQELDMRHCSLAVTTAASDFLQGTRSLIPSLTDNPFRAAIGAADVPECKRLQATRALGSACWLYAGVTFHDLPAPASAHNVIAMACLELLQVGLEVKSAGMVLEATRYCVNASQSDLGKAALIAAGAIPALIAALDGYGNFIQMCANACAALGNIANSDAGQVACVAAGAARPIVSALKLHATSVDVAENVFHAVAAISSNSCANVASFVSLGVVPFIVVAFQTCKEAKSLCIDFSCVLHCIACYPCGVEACLAAGAVPLLLAAFAKNEPARVHAKAALELLGYDCHGVVFAPS